MRFSLRSGLPSKPAEKSRRRRHRTLLKVEVLEDRRVLASLGAFVDDGSDRVYVFDPETDQVTGWVAISDTELKGDIDITSDGSKAFVTDFARRIWVVDLTQSPPKLASGNNPISISNRGEDVELTADNRFLLVTNGNGCDSPPCTAEPISVVNVETQREVSTQLLGNSTPNAVVVTKDGTVLAGRYDASLVHRLTLGPNGQLQYTGETLDVIKPINIAKHVEDRYAVVFGYDRSTSVGALTTVDLDDFSVSDVEYLPSEMAGVAGMFSDDGSILYTRVLHLGTSAARLMAHQFDGSSGRVGNLLFDVPAPTLVGYFGIEQIAISPDSTEVFVPNGEDNRIDVYDAFDGQLLRSFTGSGVDAPTGIRVLDTNQVPIANIGGPYAVAVGQSVVLDAGATTDDDHSLAELQFTWDLDGDGIFGEVGLSAAHGDEVGKNPIFHSLGIGAGTPFPVSMQVVDPRGAISTDSTTVEVGYAPDITLRASDIRITSGDPQPGEDIFVVATIRNAGLRDTGNFHATLFDFADEVADVEVGNLTPGQSIDVHFPAQQFPESYRLFTVKLDPQNSVIELEERNNESGIVVKIGEPIFGTGDASVVFTMSDMFGGTASNAIIVGGYVDYNFVNIVGERDYPMQGASVVVKILNPVTLEPISQFSGSHTNSEGRFRQSVLLPTQTGTYPMLVEVSDGTLTDSKLVQLNVGIATTSIPNKPAAIAPPPGGTVSGGSPFAISGSGGPGGAQPSDVFVFSDDIVISHQPTDIGETVSVGAFIQYFGEQAVNDVQVSLSDLFPSNGQWESLQIASAVIDFPVAPASIPTFVTIAAPWTNTQAGAHLIQVAIDDQNLTDDSGEVVSQYRGNDLATRLVNVGVPPNDLPISHQVQLLIDADGNAIPTPGDTLRYVSTIVNNSQRVLTNGKLTAQFDSRVVQSIFIQTVGAFRNGNQVQRDLPSLAPGGSATMTVDVVLNEIQQFPAGYVDVRSDLLFQSAVSIPVASSNKLTVVGDILPPELTGKVVLQSDPSQTAVPNGQGTFLQPVLLSVEAFDLFPGSGLERLEISTDGEHWNDVQGNATLVSLIQSGTTTVYARAIDRSGNVATSYFDVAVAADFEVQSTQINHGEEQRSNVTEIKIEFDQATNLQDLIDSGTISQFVRVVAVGTGNVVDLDSVVHFRVDQTTRQLTIDLTVDGFGGSEQGLLIDGQYEVQLLSDGIRSTFGTPLQDTDGVHDEVFRIEFHQLGGDFNGDRVTDVNDRNAWFDVSLVLFNTTRGTSGYNEAFDFDHDGRITSRDYYFWLRGLVGNTI
ncbi:hypothetical protein LOC67_13670 [Stieleria sp. JC731]|uniref:CARDB domain-containing protein n=1 Tax=Pirellulaceae TaxID=2691357 RepID=UPI001E3552B3|nr:CARDB domain-containing protein [Stieleria sp. JC731]MCC9601601.1 hypothetical protein [Stieleria sp. JC731]